MYGILTNVARQYSKLLVQAYNQLHNVRFKMEAWGIQGVDWARVDRVMDEHPDKPEKEEGVRFDRILASDEEEERRQLV